MPDAKASKIVDDKKEQLCEGCFQPHPSNDRIHKITACLEPTCGRYGNRDQQHSKCDAPTGSWPFYIPEEGAYLEGNRKTAGRNPVWFTTSMKSLAKQKLSDKAVEKAPLKPVSPKITPVDVIVSPFTKKKYAPVALTDEPELQMSGQEAGIDLFGKPPKSEPRRWECSKYRNLYKDGRLGKDCNKMPKKASIKTALTAHIDEINAIKKTELVEETLSKNIHAFRGSMSSASEFKSFSAIANVISNHLRLKIIEKFELHRFSVTITPLKDEKSKKYLDATDLV